MEVVLNSASLQCISRLWRKKKSFNVWTNPVILRRKWYYRKYLSFGKQCGREVLKNNSQLCRRIFIRQNKGRITAAKHFGHDCINFSSYIKRKKCRWRNKQEVSVTAAVSLVYVKYISNNSVVTKISEINSVFLKSLAVSFYKAVSYHEWQTNPKTLNRTGYVWSPWVQQIRRQHYALYLIVTLFLSCNQFFSTGGLNPFHCFSSVYVCGGLIFFYPYLQSLAAQANK